MQEGPDGRRRNRAQIVCYKWRPAFRRTVSVGLARLQSSLIKPVHSPLALSLVSLMHLCVSISLSGDPPRAGPLLFPSLQALQVLLTGRLI